MSQFEPGDGRPVEPAPGAPSSRRELREQEALAARAPRPRRPEQPGGHESAPRRRRRWPWVLGSIALVLALPLVRIYSSAKLGDRDAATVAYYSATAADYLRAHPRSATWGERTLPGRMPERALFPGVMILVLAAVALVPPLGVTRAAYAVALLVAFELSRGFNSLFYPYLYEFLPFIR